MQVTGPLQITEEIPKSPILLRPNDNGFYTQFDVLVGADTHWEAVDEEVADDATTYVGTPTDDENDTFGLENIEVPAGSIIIDNVVVHVRARRRGPVDTGWQIMIRSGTTDALGASITSGVAWTDYSHSWTTDPSTGEAWTVAAINALEAGAHAITGVDVTQVYVEVNFTPDPQYRLTITSSPDNYSVSFNQNLNLYLNWADLPRAAFAPDGSITLENSIYYSGGLYQAGVRGIPTDDIRDLAVTTAKIADENVTEAKIAPGAVTLNKLASDALARMPLLPLARENIAADVLENIDLGRAAYEQIAAGITNENIAGSAEFVRMENAAGDFEFSVTNADRRLRIQGTGAVSVRFDPTTHMIRIHAEPEVHYHYSYPYNDYRSYTYYGPRLYDVSGMPRVDYIRRGGGISIDHESRWIDGAYRDVGIIGIREDGISSAMIHEADGMTGQDTNRGYGIKTGHIQDAAITSAKIANYTIQAEDIAPRTIDASKLVWDTITRNLRTNANEIDYFRPQAITWWWWGWRTWWWYYPGRIPMFFGKASDSWGDTWNLSDFATRVGTSSWQIKNIVKEWRWGWPWEWGWYDTWKTVRIVTLNHYSEPPDGMIESKLYLKYDNTYGWIMSVTKSEKIGVYYHPDVLAHNTGFYPLDNHPERNEIFNNPGEFIVDLGKMQVRKMTAEEKEEHFAWVQAQAVEAGLQPPENVDLNDTKNIYTVRLEK